MAPQRSKLLSQLKDSHEIWYQHYATGGHPKVALYNITACRPVARQWLSSDHVGNPTDMNATIAL
jgi:hypothetical protein